MLVTFRTKAYADITMFGDVAIRLLKLMGHSGTVPSAIDAADVPAALARLEAAVAVQKKTETAADPLPAADDRDVEPVVTLSRRALPLLELLRAATAKRVGVSWSS
jgi:Domain of unknown function (DUF1840)